MGALIWMLIYLSDQICKNSTDSKAHFRQTQNGKSQFGTSMLSSGHFWNYTLTLILIRCDDLNTFLHSVGLLFIYIVFFCRYI